MDPRSHILSDKELLDFILREVKKYTGCSDTTRVLYSYNRLTIEELAQEVYLKILRTVAEVNKSYVRQTVMFVCIDEYRKWTELDSSYSEEETEDSETFKETERLMTLGIFEPKELDIVLGLMEGKRNPEIREELGIPKMSYYTMLKRIKLKYLEAEELKELQDSELA